MNKKIMLFVLPALMALSACSSIGHSNAQPKGIFFKEEADACSEVFGDKEDSIQFTRMTPLKSVEGDMVEPKVGVQYRAEYTKGGNNYIAVRFVAEIKTINVNVTWTRSVYQADGTRRGDEASYVTTKAYTSLNSNSTDITPSSGYGYFVAYTLYDIPVTTFNDNLIVAYVTLTDTTGSLPAVSSKAMAAQIGGNIQTSFAADTTGYFLAGKIGGAENSVLAPELSTPSGNVARFSSSLAENDSFYVCHKTSSTFKVYDSSCLALDNPYLQDDGLDSKKIKVLSAHNYAFNFSDEFELGDIESGYTVTYLNNSDISVTSPLIYNGVDSSSKNQYLARISPKSGSSLTFKLDGVAIAPTGEGGANIDGSLNVTNGGPEIDLYLKDQVGSYTLWVTYPNYTLSLNDVLSDETSFKPDGWADRAVFESYIENGTSIKVSYGYWSVTAADNTSSEGFYRIYLHSDGSIAYEKISASDYRLVGKINGVENWDNDSYHFYWSAKNEYRLASPITLQSGDQLKVRNGGTWYPDGSGNDYNVSVNGSYQIYFNNNGGVAGWHHGYFYVAKL